MKRAVMRGYKAPHKPILLIAIINLIKANVIVDNKIFLSNELIQEFRSVWSLLIDNGDEQNCKVSEGLIVEVVNKYPFKCSIENPFYHMNNEPFWSLIRSNNYDEKKSFTSIRALRFGFDYAIIEEDLFVLMKEENSARIIQSLLCKVISE